jgi:Ca-activated chloride channel family protein
VLSLATPLALLALPLPLLARRLLARRAGEAAALRVPASLVGLGDGAVPSAAGGSAARLALAWLAWIALVVAAAGPQSVLRDALQPMSGREIMLALDFSGSMEAKDFVLDGTPVRRIDAVKAVASEFLQRRSGDRVGLVAFAEEAQLAAVPTFDLAAVAEILGEIEIGALGRSTAIGDGLGLSLKRLKESTSPSRVVVLLSDGTNTAGAVGAEAAAKLAETMGVRVHTIALGSDTTLEGELQGASIRVDEAALSDIAKASGGSAFQVKSTDDLRQVTAAIDALEPIAFPAAPVVAVHDLWPWPAAAALLLCLAGFALGDGGARLMPARLAALTARLRPASGRPAASRSNGPPSRPGSPSRSTSPPPPGSPAPPTASNAPRRAA